MVGAVAKIRPGASAAGLGHGTFLPSAFVECVVRTPGAKFLVMADAEGLTVGKNAVQFKDHLAGSSVRCAQGQPPVSIAGLGGEPGFSFNTGPVTFTDLHINETGIPATFTVLLVVQPSSDTLVNTNQRCLLSTYDGSQMFFLSNLAISPTPATLGVGLAGATLLTWQHGGVLVAGSVHVIAVTVNAVTGTVKLLTDGVLRATATGVTPMASPLGKWFLGGQQVAATCSRALQDGFAMFHGVDLSTLENGRHLDALFRAAAAHYA